MTGDEVYAADLAPAAPAAGAAAIGAAAGEKLPKAFESPCVRPLRLLFPAVRTAQVPVHPTFNVAPRREAPSSTAARALLPCRAQRAADFADEPTSSDTSRSRASGERALIARWIAWATDGRQVHGAVEETVTDITLVTGAESVINSETSRRPRPG